MTKIVDIEFERTPEEAIEEILSRFSVTDLHEQEDADLDRAERKLDKAAKAVRVLEKGETDFIRWWKIDSGGQRYEIRRFGNFVFCSCPDFFFTKKACKHVFVTTEAGRARANRDMDNAPYLGPGRKGPIGRLGGVRF